MNPDRAARLHGAVDRAFGDDVATLKARARPDSPNGRSGPDASRPDQVGVRGTLNAQQHPPAPPYRRNQDKGAREQAANKVTWDCAAAALTWVPDEGDQLIVGGVIYAVANAARNGFGRIIVTLGADS